MLADTIDTLNRIATIVTASLVNTAPIAAAIVAAAVLAARLKSCSAASRYALWWVALAFVLAAPFASALLPDREVSPLPLDQQPSPSIQLTLPSQPATLLAAKLPSQLDLSAPAKATPVRPSGAAIFLLCSLCATALQLLRLAHSFFAGVRFKRHSRPAANELQLSFARLCAQIGMQRRVQLSISGQVASPAVIGYFRPHVMVPATLVSNLKDDELEQVLLHELSHLSRYDDWAIAAQRLIEAIAIFHPLVLFLGRRLNLDREMACDDHVAARHEANRYAACLAKIAGITEFSAPSAVLVTLFESQSELLTRVEGLLDKTRHHMPKLSVRLLIATVFALLALGTIGLRMPKLMALPSPVASLPPLHVSPLPLLLAQAAAPQEQTSNPNAISVTPEGTIKFKTDDKQYVIRDRDTVAKARRLLQPMSELGQTQRELLEQQNLMGESQNLVELELAQLPQVKITPEMQAELEKALRDVKIRIDDLDTQVIDKEAAKLKVKLAEVQRRIEEMQSRLGSETAFAEAQKRMAEQMASKANEFARWQAEFAKQQGDFSRRQADEAKRIQKELRDLIRDAQSRGLAQEVK